ncbi:MAG: hypothetical protein HN348_15740 [Proteobacteria bacterium]|jgi:tetratricopeptide (TPR) repeat protein|nr:hypothetical protein [Pseudomonadota bacterium]
MTLPKGLLEPLGDEECTGSLLTAAEHAFLQPNGSVLQGPIWLLTTASRCWLAAVVLDDHWAIAVGDPVEVKLKKGWSWDSVQVGRYEMPLRRGTRTAAQQVLKRWKEVGGGGESLHPTPEVVESTAPIAKGAKGFPKWWAAEVPGASDERWLHIVETSSVCPFNGIDGKSTNSSIYVGLSDRRIVLVARASKKEHFIKEAEQMRFEEQSTRRSRLFADEFELLGSMLTDQPLQELVGIIEPPVFRFAEVARLAIEQGEPDRALKLWQEAVELGHEDGIGFEVARLAYALEKPTIAVSALAFVLADLPAEPQGAAERWENNSRALKRSIAKKGVKWAHLRVAIQSWFDALPEAKGLEGQPWPPSNAVEIWATGFAICGRWRDAVGLWRMRKTRRFLAGLAAARTAQGHPRAADAWRDAALAFSGRGASFLDANTALEKAILLGNGADDLWLRAAWASKEDDPRSWWKRALEVDPEAAGLDSAHLVPPALRQLAELATEEEKYVAADLAWQHAIEKDPSDEEFWWIRAEAAAAQLSDLPKAIEILECGIKERAAIDQPKRPPWRWWCRIAEWWGLLGEQQKALDALKEAVGEGFLQPDAYRDVLACPQVELPANARSWWIHLLRLLNEEEETEPPVVETVLDDKALDALHPGGVGWFAKVRARIDAVEPPERSTLTRGLEKLGEEAFPIAYRALRRACEALGMDEPHAYIYRGEGAFGCSGWPTDPPVLLVGRENLPGGPRELGFDGLVFAMAVELAHLKCEHPLLMEDASLVGTSRSVYAAFGKYASIAENVVDIVTLVPGVDQLAKVEKIIRLSRKVFQVHATIGKASSLTDTAMGALGRPKKKSPPTEEEHQAASQTPEGPVQLAQLEQVVKVSQQVFEVHGKIEKATSLTDSAWNFFGLGGSAPEEEETGLSHSWEGPAIQFRIHADRVGLKICGNAEAAVHAMLLTSNVAPDLIRRLDEQGLVALLTDQGYLGQEEVIRIS